MIRISNAEPSQARETARLIMQAMNYDCCLHFIGKGYTLGDFEEIMTSLVRSDSSQYSYLNTLTAVNDRQELCGICVCYDGSRLHFLRKAFIKAIKDRCGRDLSGIADETSAGELYIDSLAVKEDKRGKGIASMLLNAAINKAKAMQLPAAGLLVDKGNPSAERLYTRLGFRHINDTAWGGHPMKHLQYIFKEEEKERRDAR